MCWYLCLRRQRTVLCLEKKWITGRSPPRWTPSVFLLCKNPASSSRKVAPKGWRKESDYTSQLNSIKHRVQLVCCPVLFRVFFVIKLFQQFCDHFFIVNDQIGYITGWYRFFVTFRNVVKTKNDVSRSFLFNVVLWYITSL